MRANPVLLLSCLLLATPRAHADEREDHGALAARLDALDPNERDALARERMGEPDTWCPPDAPLYGYGGAHLQLALARTAHAASLPVVATRCAAASLARTFDMHTDAYEMPGSPDLPRVPALERRALLLLADLVPTLDARTLAALARGELASVRDGEREAFGVNSPADAVANGCALDNDIADPSPLFAALHARGLALFPAKPTQPPDLSKAITRLARNTKAFGAWRAELAHALRRAAVARSDDPRVALRARAVGALSGADLDALATSIVPEAVPWAPISADAYAAAASSWDAPPPKRHVSIGGATAFVHTREDSLDEACLTRSTAYMRTRSGRHWRLDLIPTREDRDCTGRKDVHDADLSRGPLTFRLRTYQARTRDAPDCGGFEHVSITERVIVCEVVRGAPACVTDPTYAFNGDDGARRFHAEYDHGLLSELSGLRPSEILPRLGEVTARVREAYGLD